MTEQIIVGIIGSIIGGFIILLVGDKIRDWFSISQKVIKKEEGGTTTEATIKTKGIFSYKGHPIIIHNTGKINNIQFGENQEHSVTATPIDDSTYAVTTWDPLYDNDNLDIIVEGSGTTTVSGSSATLFRPKD